MTDDDFQSEVDRWMDACFGEEIKADQLERADRFVEESLELAQTIPHFTAERAHALVDYVFNRPVGDPQQEVGGVMVTLAALCNTVGINISKAARTELTCIWSKVEAIRAKQATKPTGSALPIPMPEATVESRVDEAASRVLHDKVHEEARRRHMNDVTQSGYDHHLVIVAAKYGARAILSNKQ